MKCVYKGTTVSLTADFLSETKEQRYRTIFPYFTKIPLLLI